MTHRNDVIRYMDHSLVMLSRKLCWSLRDVAYFALKFSGKNRKKAVQHRGDLISELNWMDQKLYDHFNASLWKQIETAPGFWEELKELRAWKDEITSACQETAGWTEDQHRAAMLGREGRRSSVELQCHMLQLDSGGFVKYLKHWHGVDAEECPVFNVGLPQKTFIFAHPPFMNTNPFTAALHRESLKKRLRLALPIVDGPNAYGAEQPKGLYKGIFKNIAKIPAKVFTLDNLQNGRPKAGYDAIVSMPFRHYDYDDLATLIPLTLSNPEAPALIIAIQDPVSRFWEMWQDPGFQNARQKYLDQGQQRITPEQFLSQPSKYMAELPSLYKRNIQNGQTNFFGVNGNSNDDAASFKAKLLQLDKKARLGVMVDYIDESKLMLARFMCFGVASAGIQLPSPPLPYPKGSELLEDTIRKFNSKDQLFYEYFNQSFWSKVKTQIRWEPDLQRMKKLQQESTELCRSTLGPTHADVHVQTNAMLLRAAPGHKHSLPPTTLIASDVGFDCASQVASPAGFVRLLRQVLGIKHLPRYNALQKEMGSDASAYDAPTTEAPTPAVNPIDSATCKREGPRKQLTVVAPAGIHAEAALRFAYRGALKYGLASSSARAPHGSEGNVAGGNSTNKIVNNLLHVAEVAVPGTASGDSTLFSQEANTLLVFEDPVHHFYHQWNQLFLGKEEVPSMLEHFNNYDLYGREEYLRFKNPQTYALFGIRFPTSEQLDEMTLELDRRFRLVFLTGRMSESLLLASKWLCWTVSDAVTEVPPMEKPPFSGVLQRIRLFNAADQHLFKHFSKRMDDLVAADRSFKADLSDTSSCASLLREQCMKIEQMPATDHLKWAHEQAEWPKTETCAEDPDNDQRSPTERVDGCRLLYLDSRSLREVHGNESPGKSRNAVNREPF